LSATARTPTYVIGGEVSRATVWQALYHGANSGMCSKKGTVSSVRCYLLNQGGAVLLAPEQSAATCHPQARGARDGCWPSTTWPQTLQFLGDVEPSAADMLVTLGVMEAVSYEIPSQRAPTSAAGYNIQAGKLPLGPLPLFGSVKADLYLRQVPGTDAYLLVLGDYRSAASRASASATASASASARQSCGVLSATCPGFNFPGIFQEGPREQVIWDARSPRRMVLSLSEDADRSFMFQIRRDSYCSVPSPWWVTLLGWCVTGAVLAGLAIVATYRKRIRELKRERRVGEQARDPAAQEWHARASGTTRFRTQTHAHLRSLASAC